MLRVSIALFLVLEFHRFVCKALEYKQSTTKMAKSFRLYFFDHPPSSFLHHPSELRRTRNINFNLPLDSLDDLNDLEKTLMEEEAKSSVLNLILKLFF